MEKAEGQETAVPKRMYGSSDMGPITNSASERAEARGLLPVIMPDSLAWRERVVQIAKDAGFKGAIFKGVDPDDRWHAAAGEHTILGIQRLPPNKSGEPSIDVEPALMSTLIAQARVRTVDHGPMAQLDESKAKEQIAKAVKSIGDRSFRGDGNDDHGRLQKQARPE